MLNKILFFFVILTTALASKNGNTQGIINNGNTIIVPSSNYVFIRGNSGNFTNHSNGALNVNGTLSLQGNWSTSSPLHMSAASGTIIFNGLSQQQIGGSDTTFFHHVTLSNSSGIILEKETYINGILEMASGCLDLRNSNLHLSATGTVADESNSNRIKATDGALEGMGFGKIICNRTLSTGTSTDIAGLGITITSNIDLGTTTIERGHTYQTNGTAASIARYFTILPTTSTGFNGTIGIRYFDAETNGQNETNFTTWNSIDNGASWTFQPPTLTNPSDNYIEKTGITSLYRWTISNPDTDPLPIEILSFDALCTDSNTRISWTTTSEINMAYCMLERSTDGAVFTPISTWASESNSNTLQMYEFQDRSWSDQVYYRLKQIDRDGSCSYSDIITSSCSFAKSLESIVAFPNPASDFITLTFPYDEKSATIRIFDTNGKCLKTLVETKQTDSVLIPVSDLNPGVYVIQIHTSSLCHQTTFIKT